MNAVFTKLLSMSVAACWLILAVLVLRLLLKKAPRWISCLLWALVAVRLVCPVSFQSPVSAYQLSIPSATVEEIGNIQHFQYVSGEASTPNDTGSPGDAGLKAPTAQSVAPASSGKETSTGEAAASGAQADRDARTVPPLVLIWLTGCCLLLLYGLGSTLRLRIRMREAARLRDNIWLCDAASSPFLLGIFSPRIYLPSSMEEKEMDYVLAHEQAHLRRGDHLWKPLGYALLALHWFNPLVWLAYWLFCRDVEAACDERVVRYFSADDRKAYSTALLACSQGRHAVLACPLAFGELGVRARIKAVLHYKKPAFWVVLAAVIACVAVAVCFLTDPLGAGGTLRAVEEDPSIYSGRGDFQLDLADAGLKTTVYTTVCKSGDIQQTACLTASSKAKELHIKWLEVKQSLQTTGLNLQLATDEYGGYDRENLALPATPQDKAFATRPAGEKLTVRAGDRLVLAAMAYDFGNGLPPELNCSKLLDQTALWERADWLVLVWAEFSAEDTAPAEKPDGVSSESLLSNFRLPVEVETTCTDTGSGMDLESLIQSNTWAQQPTEERPDAVGDCVVLSSRSGDRLYIMAARDDLLWVAADGTSAVAYSCGMTGQNMVAQLAHWAAAARQGIANAGTVVGSSAEFFRRAEQAPFRWDIYRDNGFDVLQLLTLLRENQAARTLTQQECLALLRSVEGLDGAYTESYSDLLEQLYAKDPDTYLQAWYGLTTAQQEKLPLGSQGALPWPEGIQWSYEDSAVNYPRLVINAGGRSLYMTVPLQLVDRIEQRLTENRQLGGFEQPQTTYGWSRPLVSWTAETPAVYLYLGSGGQVDYYDRYDLCRGDGGQWGLMTQNGAVQADSEVRQLLALVGSLTGWQTQSGRESFSGLTAAELIYKDKILYTTDDSRHLAQLEQLLQNRTQASYAAKTPMERVQLRLTRSDGSQVSVLLDTDSPRIFLPPFYYYVYNDYESTGTQPLLEALGLTAWPPETEDMDGGVWLTELLAQLVPPPTPQELTRSTFPLSEQQINAAITQLALPLTISQGETYSSQEGHITYTLRGTETWSDYYKMVGVSSAVYGNNKRHLQVLITKEPLEDNSLRWEDWQTDAAFVARLNGGFADPNELYERLSQLPTDQPDGRWSFEAGGCYWQVWYSPTTTETGQIIHRLLSFSCDDSEADYREMMRAAGENRDAQYQAQQAQQSTNN